MWHSLKTGCFFPCSFRCRDDLGQICFSWAKRMSWLVDFFFQELEFLAFVHMNTHTYEWSLGLPPHEPIRSAVMWILATTGGACAAAANRLPAFILDFPVVFHSQKTHRERKLGGKNPPFIKTCPGTKLLPSSLCLPDFMPETNLLLKNDQAENKTSLD